MEKVHKDNECLQASAMVQMRSSLFRDILQCRCLVSYWSVETSYQSHLQGRMRVIGCPVMSVMSFQCMLQNILEERRSQVHINYSFFFLHDRWYAWWASTIPNWCRQQTCIWRKRWKQNTTGRVQSNITLMLETGKGLSICTGSPVCGKMLTGSADIRTHLPYSVKYNVLTNTGILLRNKLFTYIACVEFAKYVLSRINDSVHIGWVGNHGHIPAFSRDFFHFDFWQSATCIQK